MVAFRIRLLTWLLGISRRKSRAESIKADIVWRNPPVPEAYDVDRIVLPKSLPEGGRVGHSRGGGRGRKLPARSQPLRMRIK